MNTKMQVVPLDPQEIAKEFEKLGKFSAYDQILTPAQKKQALVASAKIDPEAFDRHGVAEQAKLGAETKPVLSALRQQNGVSVKTAITGFVAEMHQFSEEQEEEPKKKGLIRKWFPAKPVPWAKKVDRIDKVLSDAEKRMTDYSHVVAEKGRWFERKAQDLADLPGLLYMRAAELELVERAEAKAIEALREEAETSSIPGLMFEVRDREMRLTQLRARVLDLHESAMTALLLRPVLSHARRVAGAVNSSIQKTIGTTMPKVRLLLSTLLNQEDILNADAQAQEVEGVDNQLTGMLGVAVGKTNDAIGRSLNQRRTKAEALNAAFTMIAGEIQNAVQIDDNFLATYGATLQMYESILHQAKNRGSSGQPTQLLEGEVVE